MNPPAPPPAICLIGPVLFGLLIAAVTLYLGVLTQEQVSSRQMSGQTPAGSPIQEARQVPSSDDDPDNPWAAILAVLEDQEPNP